MQTLAQDQPPVKRVPKTRAETFEGVAFTFCKTATVVLLTQRLALPVAASAAAIFFVLAYWQGKRETRCIGRYPLAIAAFWTIVAVISLSSILGFRLLPRL